MTYSIGQALGILGTLCCPVLPLLQKKWQMLAMTAAINLFCALNLVLIGRVSSVITIYVIAVVQTFVTQWHLWKNTDISTAERILFLALYVGCGSLALKGAVDLLPVVGAVFHMLATFQRDVQRTRVWLLFNAAAFLAYYLLVGSTSALSSVCTVVTTGIALYRHKMQRA